MRYFTIRIRAALWLSSLIWWAWEELSRYGTWCASLHIRRYVLNGKDGGYCDRVRSLRFVEVVSCARVDWSE
jgi:hypothetical protein